LELANRSLQGVAEEDLEASVGRGRRERVEAREDNEILTSGVRR
jgi:hypothetical protein